MMPTIEVIDPGPLTTVQDLGREGCGRIGLSRGGAADPVALRAGNLLVGNAEGAAGLEMTLVGGSFRFDGAAVVAITGADFGPTLDGRPLPAWSACRIDPGQILTIGPTRSSARSYLLVWGGILVPEILGSAATHLLGAIGGVEGRALRARDRLSVGPVDESGPPFRTGLPIDPEALKPLALAARRALPVAIRVTEGPSADRFGPQAVRTLTAAPYTVLEESNRTGLRLRGAPIPPPLSGRMVSEGMFAGAIQITQAEQPILLGVDHQTTGGYPAVAGVISADLPRVGQLRPRDEIRFEVVGLDEARAILLEQENAIRSLVRP